MESSQGNYEEMKINLAIYLNLEKTKYEYFRESPSVTAGELVERILNRFVEKGGIKDK